MHKHNNNNKDSELKSSMQMLDKGHLTPFNQYMGICPKHQKIYMIHPSQKTIKKKMREGQTLLTQRESQNKRFQMDRNNGEKIQKSCSVKIPSKENKGSLSKYTLSKAQLSKISETFQEDSGGEETKESMRGHGTSRTSEIHSKGDYFLTGFIKHNGQKKCSEKKKSSSKNNFLSQRAKSLSSLQSKSLSKRTIKSKKLKFSKK